MGLLDDILENVVGPMLGGGQAPQASDPLSAILNAVTSGNRAQGGSLLTAALAMVQQSGGLNGILDAFRRSGMSSQADSWVSTGPNVGISVEDLQQVVGGSTLSTLASQLGMSNSQASSVLAQILPELVNQLTPQGTLPDNHSDLISQGLALLRGRAG
jgi:uncharacterized protein YidB (DUF937 family)